MIYNYHSVTVLLSSNIPDFELLTRHETSFKDLHPIQHSCELSIDCCQMCQILISPFYLMQCAQKTFCSAQTFIRNFHHFNELFQVQYRIPVSQTLYRLSIKHCKLLSFRCTKNKLIAHGFMQHSMPLCFAYYIAYFCHLNTVFIYCSIFILV